MTDLSQILLDNKSGELVGVLQQYLRLSFQEAGLTDQDYLVELYDLADIEKEAEQFA